MLPTAIEEVTARTARAKLVNGVLQIKMPRHWPGGYKEQTLAKFQRWAVKQAELTATLPAPGEGDGRIWSLVEFDQYVNSINDETLQVPLKAVRIGAARRSRLAQANPQTGVLTFSYFAIDGMPLKALRYLVLHELAHLREANHSARFWALVGRHEPDYKKQRAIAQAHHARMANEQAPTLEGSIAAPVVPLIPAIVPVDLRTPDPESHPFGPLFSFVPT